jgi:hypothetical protein
MRGVLRHLHLHEVIGGACQQPSTDFSENITFDSASKEGDTTLLA